MQQHTNSHPSPIAEVTEASARLLAEVRTEWERYLPGLNGFLRAILNSNEVPAAEALLEEASQDFLGGNVPVGEIGDKAWDVVYEIVATIERQRSKEGAKCDPQ